LGFVSGERFYFLLILDFFLCVPCVFLRLFLVCSSHLGVFATLREILVFFAFFVPFRGYSLRLPGA
jgi:hypothetical protein